jgi:hypothetical protein
VAIGGELMAIGNPTAVYSTPVTRTAKDRPTETDPAVPGGLAAVPDDHWFRITRGEVLLGLFKDREGRDVVALASHNAYQPQEVTIEFTSRVKVSLFDRRKRKWSRPKSVPDKVSFRVEEYATELVRIER